MKNKKVKLILTTFISIIIPLIIEKYYFNTQSFSIDRFIIGFLLILFIGLHFVFDIKKIWNVIYKKRYIIGILIFSFLVINGYHGSSVGIYNGAIQGEYQVENGNPILGENRVIRGDEYAVASPFTLSQVSSANKLSSTNHNLMAQDKSVSFYLRYPTIDTAAIAVPQQLFFAVLPATNAFSAYWYFPMFFMFFAVFELLMILTKKSKVYSLIGTMMITFSPAVQWWSSFMIIASGAAAIVSFNQFLISDKKIKKAFYSFLIGIFGSMYIMNMYPAWLIPYGYFFLVLVCWLIYSHKDNIHIKDILALLCIVVSTIAIILVPAFLNGKDTYALISNTVYPGARFTIGGSGYYDVVKYFTNVFLPFKDVTNASEMSQFISFYPLPTVMAIYYCIKNKINKKSDYLLIGLVIVSLFLSIWNYVELPHFIAKITLMYMSTVKRADIVLGFVNVILLIICLSNYTKYSLKGIKQIILSSLLGILFVCYNVYKLIDAYPDYFSRNLIIVLTIVGFCIAFILIAINNKKSNYLLMIGLICVSILSGVTVHPLNKGLNVFYEKPIIKEIQSVVKKHPKAKWLSVSTPYFLQNYVTVTGVYMINSTNYYPNMELWKQIDPDGKYNEVYNRYAHLTVNLTNEKNSVSLIYQDHVQLDLNINELNKLDVEYILTTQDLTDYSCKTINLKEIYSEYGIFVYEVKVS